MFFKKGVKIAGVKPETVVAMNVADMVYLKNTGAEVVITEVTGGKHGRGSLHYVGLAFDCRTRDSFGDKQPFHKELITRIVLAIRERLGESYDVVIESDHLHVEFQPK